MVHLFCNAKYTLLPKIVGKPDRSGDSYLFMDIQFSGTIFQWRGPSPYFFVAVPVEESDYLQSISNAVTYGWGMIPVTAQVGKTVWTTSLFPKDDRYLLPLKDKVRNAEKLNEADIIAVQLAIRL
jgi:hypothetical protein